MTDLTIFGQVAQFIRHDGWSATEKQRRRKATKGIKLPSHTRVSHRPTTQIQELVALSYGLHPISMTSQNRERSVSWPRQIAMFLTREITARSFPEIGRVFGGRDHSTVIHAIHAVQQRMKKDPLVRADVEALRLALTR
jgi:chromosomal replication initiation ATPase DnaA